MTLKLQVREARSYRTKQQLAYDVLREAILSGELPPGQRLVVAEVSQLLGFSGMPVREAIRQLSAEGLVAIEPHVGATVTPLVEPNLDELYETRAVLEGLAARLAMRHIGDEEAVELHRLVDEMDSCIAGGKVSPRFGHLNRAFHKTLYTPCQAPLLLSLVFDLQERMARFRAQFIVVPNQAVAAQMEHRAILAAVAARDGEGAETAVRGHLIEAMHRVRAYLQPDGKDPSAAVSSSSARPTRTSGSGPRRA